MALAKDGLMEYIGLKRPIIDLNLGVLGRFNKAFPSDYGKINLTIRTDVFGGETYHENSVPDSAIKYFPPGASPDPKLEDGFTLILPFQTESLFYRELKREPMVRERDLEYLVRRAELDAATLRKARKSFSGGQVADMFKRFSEQLYAVQHPQTKQQPETIPGLDKEIKKTVMDYK